MVPWMSGLVSGLQNRARRFESARNLNPEGWLINFNQPSGFTRENILYLDPI